LIISCVFSACKTEERGDKLGRKIVDEIYLTGQPFTDNEINVLNETLSIPAENPPNDNVKHASHTGDSFLFPINKYSATLGSVLP
jgi:hypothetical protein